MADVIVLKFVLDRAKSDTKNYSANLGFIPEKQTTKSFRDKT